MRFVLPIYLLAKQVTSKVGVFLIMSRAPKAITLTFSFSKTEVRTFTFIWVEKVLISPGWPLLLDAKAPQKY